MDDDTCVGVVQHPKKHGPRGVSCSHCSCDFDDAPYIICRIYIIIVIYIYIDIRLLVLKV